MHFNKCVYLVVPPLQFDASRADVVSQSSKVEAAIVAKLEDIGKVYSIQPHTSTTRAVRECQLMHKGSWSHVGTGSRLVAGCQLYNSIFFSMQIRL